MALKTVLSLVLQAIQTNTADLSSPVDSASLSGTITLNSGTGANQADRVFHDQRTLAPSTAEDLDLAGGGLTDKFGAALTFARVKAIMIKAAAANGGNIEFGGDANSVPIFGAAADFIRIPPGGVFVWTAPDATGVAVTAGTGDILQVNNANGGASGTYDIIVVGASA